MQRLYQSNFTLQPSCLLEKFSNCLKSSENPVATLSLCSYIYIYIYILEWLKQILRKGCGDIQNFIATYHHPPSSSRNRVTHYYFIFKCIEFIYFTEKITCLVYDQNPGRPMRGHEAKYIH